MRARRKGDNGLSAIERRSMPEPNSGCWLWLGRVNHNGYGVFMYRMRSVRAHRISYEFAFGSVPAGQHVCHKCDVRSCVNPAHLWLGSQKENIADAITKGRFIPRRSYIAHLSAGAVRSLYLDSRSYDQIATSFDLSWGHVWKIKNGRSWSEITKSLGDPPPCRPAGKPKHAKGLLA